MFIISDEKETGLSGMIIALIVGAVVCIILIVGCTCIYKKRKHICKKRQDGIDSSATKLVSIN